MVPGFDIAKFFPTGCRNHAARGDQGYQARTAGSEQEDRMKLYGTPPTRAIRALWVLTELEIDCEVVTVNMGAGEHLSPEFLALNPAGKFPALVDGDLVLTESAAIQLYLAEKCPNKGLIPSALADRAQMYRWIFFLVTEIEQPLWRIALHRRIYAENERSPQEVALATRDGKRMVEVLERHMKERQFLAGDRLTVADLNAAYTLDWANEAGLLTDAPRLRAFLKTMYARPKAPPTIAEGFAALQR
jgi:glutathione S-transferase